MENIDALTFDLFGTVVDWQTTLVRELTVEGGESSLGKVDWTAFANEWRATFWATAAEVVKTGEGPRSMDLMHREILDGMLESPRWAHIAPVWDDQKRKEITQIWHRLDGFPDSAPALHALKKHTIVAVLSNGNTRLLVDISKNAGLPWDVVFSAEAIGSYKPDPRIYHHATNSLQISPHRCAMVASHIMDLRGAAAIGMKTVYVRRADEDRLGEGEEAPRSKREGGEVDWVVNELGEVVGLFEEAKRERAGK